MAKETPVPKVEHKEKSKSPFSIFLFLVGLILMIAAVVSYYNWYTLNKVIFEALLFFGGLIVLLMTFVLGYQKVRREFLKKYI